MSQAPDRDINAWIGSLEAYLAHLRGDSEAALGQLEDCPDPDSLRRRLIILLDTGRAQEAAELARRQECHESWCDVVVRVFVRAGDSAQALAVVQWARTNASRLAAQRSAVFFAIEEIKRIAEQRSGLVVPGALADAQRQSLVTVIEVLAPIVTAIGDRIENELESQAIQATFVAQDYLGDQSEMDRLARTLASRRPIPILLANAVIRGRVAAPPNLPERLRSEHPDSIEAKIRAVAVEGRMQGRTAEAYSRAKELAQLVSSSEEQDQLGGVMIDLAQRLDDPALREEGEQLAASILHDERYRQLLRADRSMRHGAIGAAAVILDETRDEADPLWLQLQAKRLLQEGKGDAAAAYLLKAAATIADPDALKTAAALAYEHRAFDVAVSALENLIALRPDEGTAYRHLAMIDVERGKFAAAADQFQRLAQEHPLDDSDRFNWALCLARAGDPAASLEVLKQFSDRESTPFAACLLRADVLVAQGNPHAAFESLNQVKDRFWQEPDFLQKYLKLGFMSSNEPEGHEALVQIQLLQAEGRARDDVLKAVPVDAPVADIKERREKQREAHMDMLQGRMSWLIVDMAFGGSPYWAWRIRTQELRWLGDAPDSRAQFTVYSTNGFRVRPEHDGSATLDEIECPPRGTAVVADLSALISLHRLDLLATAGEYFGRILIPSAYLQNLINEASQLLTRQPSRRKAAEAIWEAVATGGIASPENEDVQRASEYETEVEGSPSFRIRDILGVLHRIGRLADARYQELLERAHQPERGGLQPGQALVIQLATLQTLTDFDLLKDLIETFRIATIPADRAELESEIRAFEAQEEVRQWHIDLWNVVRSDPRFVQSVETMPPEIDKRGAGPWAQIPLVAVLLARDSGVPLLADDRVCQAVALNERPTEAYAGFGTDAFLRALRTDETISAERAADAFLQLVSWRYRFLVLPPEILVTLANRFADHPPGHLLRRVALYVHDSMRDPGLLGGHEPTEPPMSMAEKFFMEWTASTTRFLTLVWSDAKWPEDRLRTLTRWVVTEFLPSLPRTTAGFGNRLNDVWKRHVLSHFFIWVARHPDSSRANLAVRAVAEALGIDEREYLMILSGVVDES